MPDKVQQEADKKAKALAKAERKKQHEAQMVAKGQTDKGAGGTKKSKAELKAERRAIQEAQRAAKSAPDQGGAKTEGVKSQKPKQGGTATEHPKDQGALSSNKPKKSQQDSQQQQQQQQQQGNQQGNQQQSLKKQTSSSSVVPSQEQLRVSSNIQMDNKKVQRRITRTLAKQNVPQRSSNQKKVQMFNHLHQYEKDLSLTKKMRYTL